MSRQRKRVGVVIVLTVVGLAGAVPPAGGQEHTKDSLETVKRALAVGTAVLVDVREKAEWDQGHLRDARLLPLSSLGESPLPKALRDLLPRDKAIYLHCAAGRRCLKAAEVLRKEGYDVRPLKNGYESLRKEGFPKAGD